MPDLMSRGVADFVAYWKERDYRRCLGKLGCYANHVRAWEHIVAADWSDKEKEAEKEGRDDDDEDEDEESLYLVLEDDVEFRAGWHGRLGAVLAALPPGDFDILRLGFWGRANMNDLDRTVRVPAVATDGGGRNIAGNGTLAERLKGGLLRIYRAMQQPPAVVERIGTNHFYMGNHATVVPARGAQRILAKFTARPIACVDGLTRADGGLLANINDDESSLFGKDDLRTYAVAPAIIGLYDIEAKKSVIAGN
uniref:Uncharacterized protein n=1 Tax=Lotharella oceanica TaxID=641309 RepID=A0A7S2TTL7_9EUKA|mmetsp:Transcript_26862/g.50165  ORF Transcript_26862/g.50165 Transcript_26862/m.50165 type:complete len:252 (+) Transcript_26862:643-1398(+)